MLQLSRALCIKPYQLLLEDGDIEVFNRKELLTRFSEELKEGIAGLINSVSREKLRRKKR